jgi:1,4-alpha-glucan branching enzyme
MKTGPGRYRIVLNSDSPDYGGFGRIDENIDYFTQWDGKVGSPHFLKLYIPNRTAIVFEKQKTRGVHRK